MRLAKDNLILLNIQYQFEMNAQRVNGITHFDLAVNVGKVGKKWVYGYYDFKTT